MPGDSDELQTSDELAPLIEHEQRPRILEAPAFVPPAHRRDVRLQLRARARGPRDRARWLAPRTAAVSQTPFVDRADRPVLAVALAVVRVALGHLAELEAPCLQLAGKPARAAPMHAYDGDDGRFPALLALPAHTLELHSH